MVEYLLLSSSLPAIGWYTPCRITCRCDRDLSQGEQPGQGRGLACNTVQLTSQGGELIAALQHQNH